jgi:hypothetical protein
MRCSINLISRDGTAGPQSGLPLRLAIEAREDSSAMTIKNFILAALASVAFVGAAIVAIAPADPERGVLVAFQVRR